MRASSSLVAKSGSREHLKVRLQPMRGPDAPHRAQRDADRRGHARPVQWVASPDGSAQVIATTRAVVSAGSGGVPGGRVLSRKSPSTPASAKRCCQRHTSPPNCWRSCPRVPSCSPTRPRCRCLPEFAEGAQGRAGHSLHRLPQAALPARSPSLPQTQSHRAYVLPHQRLAVHRHPRGPPRPQLPLRLALVTIACFWAT